jgi:hypothetical protein
LRVCFRPRAVIQALKLNVYFRASHGRAAQEWLHSKLNPSLLITYDQRADGELLLAMNQKLNEVIAAEVGEDNGDFLPENNKGWAVTRFDL